MPLYGVQVHWRREILVNAPDEAAALKIAEDADVDASGMDRDGQEIDLVYDADEDAECVAEFKRDGLYFE